MSDRVIKRRFNVLQRTAVKIVAELIDQAKKLVIKIVEIKELVRVIEQRADIPENRIDLVSRFFVAIAKGIQLAIVASLTFE